MHDPLPKRAGSVHDRTTRRTRDACGNVERMHLPFPVSRRCFATPWCAFTPGSRERGQYPSSRCGRWASCWMKDMRLKQGCTSLAVGSLWWISCPCPRERAHLPTMRDERWADPFTFVIYGEDAPLVIYGEADSCCQSNKYCLTCMPLVCFIHPNPPLLQFICTMCWGCLT